MKGLAKEHIGVTHTHRQQYDDGQRERGDGAGWRWAKEEEMGASVIVLIITPPKKKQFETVNVYTVTCTLVKKKK